MLKTPQKFFFALFLICLVLGYGIQIGRESILTDYLNPLAVPISLSEEKKLLISHNLEKGNVDAAISIYELAISGLETDDVILATKELNSLLDYSQSSKGQFINFLANISWKLPFRLFFSAGIIAVVWIIIVTIAKIKTRPLFLIFPFEDFSQSGLEEKIPELSSARIREFIWSTSSLQKINDLLADNLELPTMGFIQENRILDTAFLVETAFTISTGITDIPISKLFNSIRLWFDQPKYYVRGVINKYEENVYIEIHLLDASSGSVEKIWYAEIEQDEAVDQAMIVSNISYAILHHFNKSSSTKEWIAFKYLHLGIRELNYYQENSFNFSHLQRAKAWFNKSKRVDPTYEIAQYNLGLVKLILGEYDDAKEDFKELVGTSDKSLSQFAKYNYGVALFSISQDWSYKYATKIFEELLCDLSNSKHDLLPLTKATLALVYAKLANRKSMSSKEYSELALNLSDDILEKSENSEIKSYANAAKGWAYLARKDFTESIQAFKKSIRSDPSNLQGYLGLAELYETQNNFDDALIAFRNATLISPLSEYAYYRIGLIYYWRKKDPDNAAAALANTKNFSKARLLLGKIHLEGGHLYQALDEFKIAARNSSKLSEAWVNIAWTLLTIGDDTHYSEAELAARRALQLEPKNSEKIWHRHAILAKCLYENNKFENAHQQALLATNVGKNQAQGFLYLGQIQFALGYIDHAKESVQKVFELDKKNVWLSEATVLFESIQMLQDNAPK